MTVPFYDFPQLHNETFRIELLERYDQILKDNSFIEGQYNALFEKEFAKLQQAKHCCLVANGTDALEISLKAYGIQPGDLVGVPAISYFASAEAIINVGANVVFIDINPVTGLICPESTQRILQQYDLKAIIPVHIYGLPVDLEAITPLCQAKNVAIVEDGAQAAGATLSTGPVGSSPNLTTFSFYPTKNLGALGDAGAILTTDDDLAETIKLLRNHGRLPSGHQLIGRNSRCDHFQAAALHLKLEKYLAYNKIRQELARYYWKHLQNLPLGLLPKKYLETSAWHLFPLALADEIEKTRLQTFLKQKGIGTAPFYELAMSQEKPLQDCPGENQKAHEFAGTRLCLPLHPHLSASQMEEVIQEVRNFFS